MKQSESFKNTVLILNPLSSPNYLCEKFNQAGFLTLACFTNRDIDHLIHPILEQNLFDHYLFLSKQFDQDIQLIHHTIQENKLNILLAFSSSEFELDYADKIVYCFCPQYANDPGTSEWRNNKYLMNLRLRKNKTPSTRQILVNYVNDISWDNLEFPLVVKPTEGGTASIGVHICNTSRELEHYFATINQKQWGYFPPTSFLLEEFLIGDEYVIDMVAWEGKYHLIGIYYAEKRIYQSHKICHHREFMHHDHPQAKELYAYCSRVLKNLDVQYGMMHLECMMTKNGPRLIELNPRVSGVSGMLNYFSEAMIGCDQASLFIRLFKQESQSISNTFPSHKKHGVVFYLQNFGFQYSKIREQLFKSLLSYRKHLVKIAHAPIRTYPANLLDTVALVLLVHESPEQVEQDLTYLKRLEITGELFENI